MSDSHWNLPPDQPSDATPPSPPPPPAAPWSAGEPAGSPPPSEPWAAGEPAAAAPPPYVPPAGMPTYVGQGNVLGAAPRYASWIYRVGAYLIDAIVIGVISLVFRFIGGGSLESLVGFILYLANWGYLQSKDGKTIGKRVLGIHAVREATGQPPSFGMGVLRLLLLIVDFAIIYIGVLWPLWDRKRQCLVSDKATGTVVLMD